MLKTARFITRKLKILSLRMEEKIGRISLNSSNGLQPSVRFKNLLSYLDSFIRRKIVNYTKVVIYEKSLTNIPRINTRIKVNIKLTSLDEIRKICVMRVRNKDSLTKRLNDGHLCFIAEREGDIVGYCWVAFQELYVSEIDKKIKFSNTEACLYDAFVFPEYRRKRIYQKMLVEIFKFLRKKGHEKAFINILSTNISSQRGVEHVGFQSIKNVTFLRLFGLRKYAENESVSKK
jgi:GNAT superfamily N-acetyltransferase